MNTSVSIKSANFSSTNTQSPPGSPGDSASTIAILLFLIPHCSLLIHSVLNEVFPLAGTADAFRYFARGSYNGKVVIKIVDDLTVDSR